MEIFCRIILPGTSWTATGRGCTPGVLKNSNISNWPAETFLKITFTAFRYSTWVFSRDYPPSDCHGRPKREICNFGVLDLPMLRSLRSHLFLNKFDLAVDALAVGCWAELVASGRGD